MHAKGKTLRDPWSAGTLTCVKRMIRGLVVVNTERQNSSCGVASRQVRFIIV